MVFRLNESPTIDNVRNYPDETVEKLRALLAAGAQAYPDPRRKNFYELENGSRVYYIHLTPCGKVLLLATWLKDSSAKTAPEKEWVAA